MASQKQTLITAALVGAMSPEGDVAAPHRARSASFASAITDLKVGDPPTAKVMLIDADMTIGEAITHMSQLAEKFRNNIQSSVSQAKRRVAGADYSIEINDVKMKSGMYLLALVHRVV